MFTLSNQKLGILVENIPDVETAHIQFVELIAEKGDLPSTTDILDSDTGEVIHTFGEC